ncbi:FeoC-like transcriptional regulator [Legionella yabuuchiae]|uniref:FeoC-like transcriptional regulator n=1 Tax=Legionella yabuuchiae TaxID=376727 RepID=UPI0010569901|nr:FeoC-like transcriptional regulator [Legionella yabuuchiae]
MLIQIRDYIIKHGVVSTQQLERLFHLDEQALLPMLNLWVTKGIIRPCKTQTACQTRCFRCKVNSPVYYEAAVLDS